MIITKKDIQDRVNLVDKVKENIKEFDKLAKQLNSQTYDVGNICLDFWSHINNKYCDNFNLITADGDVYYVLETLRSDVDFKVYLAKRIKFDLSLSKQEYEIVEDIDREDGEYNFSTYYVRERK